MPKRTQAEVEAAVRVLIEWAGDDPDREGLLETPARVARAYRQLFAGYEEDARDYLEKTFEEVGGYDELIVLRDIRVVSFCEHHMLPFTGRAHVGYLPTNRVVGISKLSRVVNAFSRRLQIQEKLTADIAEAIQDILQPQGVGVMIEGQEGLTWERWLRLTEAAEDMGYESLCRSDHLTSLAGESKRPSLETWTSLTLVAARTRRIRFGPMVSPVTFYQPALLAKMAVALDTLSHGRLDLGLGAGWNEPEHATFGIRLPPVKERLDRLEAAARYIRALGVGEPVTLDQSHYALRKAENYPLPTYGRLRLVIGGRGEKRTLRIAAEFADEWNVTRVDPDGFRQKREVLAQHCATVRRDPETIARSLMIPLAIGHDRPDVARRIAAARAVFPQMPADEAAWRKASFLVGTPSEVVENLEQWRAAGVQRVLLQMLDQEDLAALQLFARHVLPHIK